MEDKKPQAVKWFFTVLTNPGQVYKEIMKRPAFFKPALVACGINVLLILGILPKIREFTLWTLKNSPVQIPPEQLAANQGTIMAAAMATSVVTALIAPWLLWLIIAGLLKIYDLFSAGETRFGTLYAVAVYGYLPMLIGNLIHSVVVAGAPVENFAKVSLSLAAFLPYQKSFLYFFLTACNPFIWWSLVLWGIGGAIAMKNKSARGVLVFLFSCWLVYAVGMVLYALAKVPSGVSF